MIGNGQQPVAIDVQGIRFVGPLFLIDPHALCPSASPPYPAAPSPVGQPSLAAARPSRRWGPPVARAFLAAFALVLAALAVAGGLLLYDDHARLVLHEQYLRRILDNYSLLVRHLERGGVILDRGPAAPGAAFGPTPEVNPDRGATGDEP